MANEELKRGLGLGGAVSIFIGYVIGASIFILIGPIAFKTGPALWVTYLIASLPAIFMCFTSAQIGSTLPVAGANYVLVSRTMGPFWGFMTVWTILITTLIGIPLIAFPHGNGHSRYGAVRSRQYHRDLLYGVDTKSHGHYHDAGVGGLQHRGSIFH